MPLQTNEYKQFLERSRDKIAEWIDHPKVKDLFAEDMNEREEDFKRYKAAAEENLQIEKNKSKRYVEWTKKNPLVSPIYANCENFIRMSKDTMMV